MVSQLSNLSSPEQQPRPEAGEITPIEMDSLLECAHSAIGKHVESDYFDTEKVTLSTDHSQWFDPLAIESALLRPLDSDPQAVDIDPQFPNSRRIVLCSDEFDVVSNVSEMLGRKLKGKALHIANIKQAQADEYIAELRENRAKLEEFEQNANASGWGSLKPSEVEQMIELCGPELVSILDILENQDSWPDGKRAEIEKGVIYALTHGERLDRVQNLRKTVLLTKVYLARRTRTLQNYHNAAALHLQTQNDVAKSLVA